MTSDAYTRACEAREKARHEKNVWKDRWKEAVRHADEAFAERDQANALLERVHDEANDLTAGRHEPNFDWREGWDAAMSHILNILDGKQEDGE